MKKLEDLVSKNCYDEIVAVSKKLFGEAFDYIFPSIKKALERGNGNVRREILEVLGVESCRVCDVCGKLMEEGYLCEDSLQYSCSKRCLKKRNNWSEKEFRDWEKNWSDSDSLYWTEWY